MAKHQEIRIALWGYETKWSRGVKGHRKVATHFHSIDTHLQDSTRTPTPLTTWNTYGGEWRFV